MKPKLYREDDKIYVALRYIQRDDMFYPIDKVEVTEDFQSILKEWIVKKIEQETK